MKNNPRPCDVDLRARSPRDRRPFAGRQVGEVPPVPSTRSPEVHRSEAHGCAESPPPTLTRLPCPATVDGPESRASQSQWRLIVARRRFQTGCLTKLGKRRRIWVIRWREDVLRDDGTVGRIQRAETIGTVAELPNRRDALAKMEERLRKVNHAGSTS